MLWKVLMRIVNVVVRMHTQNVNFFRVFSLLVLRKVKCLSYFYLLDVLPHSLLVSSLLSHTPLLLLFNWGSFLYGLNFCKSISKTPEKKVMASLSAAINTKILCWGMQIIDVKISTSCSETVPRSTLYLGWRREFHITAQWASFLIMHIQRNRNVNAWTQPEFITECTETTSMPWSSFCVPAEQPKMSECRSAWLNEDCVENCHGVGNYLACLGVWSFV